MNAFRKWLIVLVLLGVVARVGGALLFSGNYSMDHAVPCLMTKHIVEGRDWPAFYYGQPYMGSIESFVSSFFYRLPIDKNFACNLGTGFFGMLILPFIWYWGRGGQSWSGGITALALIIIGPPVYMQFMNWSYGGYAAVTFFQVALITTAVAIVVQERKQAGCSPIWQWSLLGLFAGAGWWTSPMIMPGLLAVAILMVVQLGCRCFQPKLLLAAAVFLLGSLPLWWWNFHNQWETIAFLRRGSGDEFLEGLAKFFPGMLVAVSGEYAPWTVPLGLLVAFCMVYAAVVIFKERKNDDLALYHLAAWLTFLTTALFFAGKPERIGPSRYFLPLVPIIAVLVGHAIAVLNRKIHRRVGWLLLLILVADQSRILPIYAGWYQSRHQLFAELEEMRTCFDKLDTDVIYGTYTHRTRGYGLNFYYDEKYRFVDFPFHERQPEYTRAVELVENPAVFNHLGRITEFLRGSGGSASYMTCATDCHLTFNMSPPIDNLVPITSGFTIIDTASGATVTRQLTDHHHGTYWVNNRFRNNKAIEVYFDQPVDVAAVRLISQEATRPSMVRIAAKTAGNSRWTTIAEKPFGVWFWSGLRPYPRGTHYRQEFRLRAGDDVQALRFEFGDEETDRQIRVQELHLYSEQMHTWPTSRDVKVLAGFLVSHGITRVYCDRWEANQLYRDETASFMLSLDALVFRNDYRRLPSEVFLNESLAMVLHPREAHATREVLTRLGVPFKESEVSGWRVLLIQSAVPLFARHSPLRWAGYGVVLDHDYDWLDAVVKLVRDEIKTGQVDAAAKMLTLLEDLHPTNMDVLQARYDLTIRQGDEYSASATKMEMDRLSNPQYVVNAEFDKGVRMTGLNAEKRSVARGEAFHYQVFWHIPHALDASRLAMFMHFRDDEGKVRFQGDRVLVDDREYEEVTRDRIVERRSLIIPKDAIPGEYIIHIGLYEANPPHDKWKVRRADVTYKRGHVELPFKLRVVE